MFVFLFSYYRIFAEMSTVISYKFPLCRAFLRPHLIYHKSCHFSTLIIYNFLLKFRKNYDKLLLTLTQEESSCKIRQHTSAAWRAHDMLCRKYRQKGNKDL
ncbi:hypothetical protein BRYFOR_07014 [Marvinbryantia formatexigens DSM 14469]|uniref:Uncharacterized protein n=1 Tax=Marvinbryantia formatexigens DSM 14469 TaxID=478749 RepID=C6LEG5_9FIRM|nr:hypothetical protein BRYFOR_07014 [Marvinbryantia formatexigens DSM 14469]